MNNKFDFKSISSSQASIMGDLQRLLSQGEYAPFTSAPIFEGKFVQVKSHSNEIIWHAQDKTACNDYPFFFLSSRGIPHSSVLTILILCLLYTYGYVSFLLKTHSAHALKAVVQKPSNSNAAN